jgi:hypothetical protein
MESDPFHQITLDCLINKKHRGKILGINNDNNKVNQEERDLYSERVLNLAKHLLDLSADTDDIYSDVKDSYEAFLCFTIQFLKDLDEKERNTTIDDEYIDTSEYTEAEEESQLHVKEQPVTLVKGPFDNFISVKSLPTNKKKYGKK